MAVFRRFYRVRPLAALLICLPGLLLSFWYTWSTFSSFDRYRRLVGEKAPLSLEDFHLQLFDILSQDLRRLTMTSAPDDGGVERFAFHVSKRSLGSLFESAALESQRPYVPAQLENRGSLQDVELRLRGQQHWHILGRKKSLKVRLPRGDLLDGLRVFNLVNDPDPMVVGEEIILDIARQQGILVPRSSFARVIMNGADLGVFRYQAQVDESLLRQNLRMPGSIFSGNLPGSVKTKKLWNDATRWKKVAWRNQESKDDFGELERLLRYLRESSLEDFAAFARREIDLQAFAVFEALDVIFGVEEHDFRQNHKLYFDPYKGRWEPVAWDLRGFRHERFFNLVENPLLLRLKLVPEYLSLRNRVLYRLLVGDCSVPAVRQRGMELLRKLAPQLASDSYWSAYKLLPRVDEFHRRMLRPMSLKRLGMVFESEMATFEHRHSFLIGELQKNPLWLLRGEGGELQLVVDGQAGVNLTGFKATWSEGCRGKSWRVLAERNPVTDYVSGDYAAVNRELSLYPAVELVPREDVSSKRGKVRSRMVPRSYSFQIESGCLPEKFAAEGIQLATGARALSRPLRSEGRIGSFEKELGPGDVPRLAAGEASCHPWLMKPPRPETITLGPGAIEVEETRVFEPQQTVKVAPGTVFRIGPGASLVFLGQVFFRGTEGEPIRIEPSTSDPWGGVVLQGPATAGSVLEHVTAEGGSVPSWGAVPYPGMVNIHDSGDIAVKNCRFGKDTGAQDVFHAVYVKNLLLEDTAVEDASADAIDLEFVTGALRRVQASRARDELLDFMGSRVEVAECVLVGCSGNGVSAGEESHLMLRDSLVAGCRVGALAKNASVLELSGSLLYQNRTGIRVYRRDVRFQGESKVLSDDLFVVDSERLIKRDDRSVDALDLGQLQRRLPPAGVLDHLTGDVLDLPGWEALPALVENIRKGGPR